MALYYLDSLKNEPESHHSLISVEPTGKMKVYSNSGNAYDASYTETDYGTNFTRESHTVSGELTEENLTIGNYVWVKMSALEAASGDYAFGEHKTPFLTLKANGEVEFKNPGESAIITKFSSKGPTLTTTFKGKKVNGIYVSQKIIFDDFYLSKISSGEGNEAAPIKITADNLSDFVL